MPMCRKTTMKSKPNRLYENPHWNLKIPNIRYDLRTEKKSQTNPLDFIMKFNEIERIFERHVFIYTDGSKDQRKLDLHQ